MGLGASSYNYLFLQAELSNNQRELMNLSNQKMALTRDASKVSREYQEALCQKTLKWSMNSGSTYTDLTYNSLMKPDRVNNNTPHILSDLQGRVVIDNSYLPYAQMISPNGKSGADYESVKHSVLSKITGIPLEKLQGNATNEVLKNKQETDLKKLKLEEPSKASFTNYGAYNLLTLNNDATGKEIAGYYINPDSLNDGKTASGSDVKSMVNTVTNYLKSISSTMLDKKDAFDKACDDVNKQWVAYIDNGKESAAGAITGKPGEYKLNVQELINQIFDTAKISQVEGEYVWYDTTSSNYDVWKTAHDAWAAEYATLEAQYNATLNNNDVALTAGERSTLAFYDLLFSTIAENGWTQNDRVNDTEYLNQTLQNNLFTLTTVKRTQAININTGKVDWSNDYETNIAQNFSHIFCVSDSDIREQALIDYENKKRIINQKETKIDNRMNLIQTENDAIKKMMESVKKMADENTERTMDIFS